MAVRKSWLPKGNPTSHHPLSFDHKSRVRRVLSISLATLICTTTVSAQLTGLTVETVTVHDGSIPELAGYTAFMLSSEFDFVSAVYGDDNAPLLIGCTDGSFFQSTPGNQAFDFGNQINPVFFGAFPELEYDSCLPLVQKTLEQQIR